MALRADLARTAFEDGPAKHLGMSVEEASYGAVQILTHSMVQSIEENSVRKGYDPRDFALVAEGGAGPLFAAQIALEVGTPWVIVPRYPGVTARSACSRPTWSTSTPRPSTSESRSSTRRRCSARSRSWRSRRVRSSRRTAWQPTRSCQRVCDCRYLGQGYELRVDVPAGAIDHDWIEKVRADFHDIHEREYSRRFEESDIELPNVRVRGIGLMPELEVPEVEHGPESPEQALTHEGQAWFRVDGVLKPVSTRYYDREQLLAGNRLDGPAIVNQYDSTTVIPPGIGARRPLWKHRYRGGGVRRGQTACGRDGGDGMSVMEYEVGKQPGRPPEAASRSTRSRSESSAAPSTPSPRRWPACSSA